MYGPCGKLIVNSTGWTGIAFFFFLLLPSLCRTSNSSWWNLWSSGLGRCPGVVSWEQDNKGFRSNFQAVQNYQTRLYMSTNPIDQYELINDFQLVKKLPTFLIFLNNYIYSRPSFGSSYNPKSTIEYYDWQYATIDVTQKHVSILSSSIISKL